MPVDVQIATDIVTPATADIESWALAALSGADSLRSGGQPATSGDVCIRVVDEVESRMLNRDYRRKDAPTNVLSFAADVVLPESLILGDVVVCAPVVAGEAEVQGKTYGDHFAHVVVHGVLHLLGYDHETDAEASVMEELERGILGRFGVGDPYGEG